MDNPSECQCRECETSRAGDHTGHGCPNDPTYTPPGGREAATADVNAQPLRYCTGALGGDQALDEPDYLCSHIAGHDGTHEDREPNEAVTWTDETPGAWYLSEHNPAVWDLSD